MNREMTRQVLAIGLATGLFVAGCTGSGNDVPEPAGAEGLIFCDDRVDDDDDGDDEPCPATQPADAPVAYDCAGAPPPSVLAHVDLPSNDQVASGCVYIYQGGTGAFYAAVDIENGPEPTGPMGQSTGLCSYDRSARRHVFMTTSPLADCPDLTYVYPDMVENQLLSNGCRRMVRNIGYSDADFDPDIQFLAGDEADQRNRIDVFDTVEVACLGINNTLGAPYRTDEVYVTQSSGSWLVNPSFTPQE